MRERTVQNGVALLVLVAFALGALCLRGRLFFEPSPEAAPLDRRAFQLPGEWGQYTCVVWRYGDPVCAGPIVVFETTKADQPVFWVDPDPPDGLTGFTWFTTEGEVRHASFDPVGPLFRLEDGGPLRAGTVVLYRPDTRDVVVLAEQWDVRLADAEHTPGLERYVVSLLEERALSESE